MQISSPPQTSGNQPGPGWGGGIKSQGCLITLASVVIMPPSLLFCLYVHENVETWVRLAAALPFDLVCGKMENKTERQSI